MLCPTDLGSLLVLATLPTVPALHLRPPHMLMARHIRRSMHPRTTPTLASAHPSLCSRRKHVAPAATMAQAVSATADRKRARRDEGGAAKSKPRGRPPARAVGALQGRHLAHNDRGGGGVIFFRLANCVFLERPFLSRAHSESMGCLHELIALHWRTVGPSLHCSQDAGGASNDTSASSSGTEPEVLSPHPADASSAAAASMTAAAVSATPQERGASATAMPPATPLPESARSHFHMHACAGSPHHTTPRDTLSAGPCALGRERNYFKQHRRPCQMKYWWKART